MSYWNTYKDYKVREFFDNNKIDNNKIYILLGDSILQNNAYVQDGNSIKNLMIERTDNVYCYAEDNSKISDILYQINKISTDLNNSKTYIFLSAGGNNILSYYVDQTQDITDTSILQIIFKEYENLVKSIQNRLPKANIILLDIYYPDNLQYKKFHSIIKEWNNMIYDFVKNPKNHIYGIIKISSHLTQKDDFSFGLEPSSTGGKKIVNLILDI
jgi:hypothetical protein